ncbi:hypothetical protein [Pseudomonas sp. BIC9C]|uniref:hypothetical protein n=1 Tax=Pseudomonas sp. BIC9C TaxID=3078458 RepID=UPI002AD2E2F9|nr:hypothetical protein [Pseudomonas sp. BIC9C]
MAASEEKYAREIEIFTLSRGFGAQISHSDAQKKAFSAVRIGSLEKPTFSTESAGFCLSPPAAFGCGLSR